jgi:hypothetical protein
VKPARSLASRSSPEVISWSDWMPAAAKPCSGVHAGDQRPDQADIGGADLRGRDVDQPGPGDQHIEGDQALGGPHGTVAQAGFVQVMGFAGHGKAFAWGASPAYTRGL